MTAHSISLREWDGAAGRTLIQGLRIGPQGMRIITQADTVAGQTLQDVVFRFHDADGKYLYARMVKRGGHGSTTDVEITGDGCNLWLKHEQRKRTGYLEHTIGGPLGAFVPAAVPAGDPAIDQAADLICIRNGLRFRGYRLSAAKAGRTEKLWDIRIPAWGVRFQGHLIHDGKLYVSRDVATKGASMAHQFTYGGKLVGSLDTRGMGDEAEGFVVIDDTVCVVKRTGNSGPSRVVRVTPWK